MKKFILPTLAVVLLVTILTYKMFRLGQMECGLCIHFNGKKQCAKALGPNEEEATTEAHRNACAIVASGVTEVVTCNQAAREEISCSNP